MSDDSSLVTRRGAVVIGRLAVALLGLAMLTAGLWMLNQVLDSVVAFGRGYVDFPYYPAHVDIWFYHDIAYALLWVAYAGLVLWEVAPWRNRQLGVGRFIIALLGFAILTAGLWLSQDLMNAVLVLHRSYVDLPFSIASTDLYQTRDIATTLVVLAYVGFFALDRATRRD